MSLESRWGQAAYVARQLPSTAGWSSPPKWSRELDAVTLDAGRARRARRCSPGRAASATIGVPAVRAA